MSNTVWPCGLQVPGFSVHRILQARILEWVALLFSMDLPYPEIELASHVSCTGRQVLYYKRHLGSPKEKNSPLSRQFCIVLSTQRGDSNFNFLQFSPAFPSVWISTMGQTQGFLGNVEVKNSPANGGNTGDASSIPGSGRFPGVGNDNPLQYSCLGNPMDRGAWCATVHGVAKSWTWLSDFTSLYLSLCLTHKHQILVFVFF